ncbi:MAG: hypothetical protein LBM73_03430 [Candidatus Nomurabacteria bacterium]|jgi:hypothetical protein|nr:hypothetical protein [Candidatus Nomurabacteria bacterium]
MKQFICPHSETGAVYPYSDRSCLIDDGLAVSLTHIENNKHCGRKREKFNNVATFPRSKNKLVEKMIASVIERKGGRETRFNLFDAKALKRIARAARKLCATQAEQTSN